jgi:hypothetical protein
MKVFNPAKNRKYLMLLIDFSDFGIHEPTPVDRLELAAIQAGAEGILATYSDEAIELLLDQWELGLNYRALEREPVDEEWYTRALLCIALQGYLGIRAPRFHLAGRHD